MQDIENDLSPLIQLLEAKLNLLDEILKFTHKQTEVLQSQEIERLDHLIKSKQKRIDKIDRLDKAFNKQFAGIKKKYGVEEIAELDIDKSLVSVLKSVTKKIQNIIHAIYDIEQVNKGLINKNYNDVKSRLKNIKKGKKLTSSYYKQSTQTDGYFIDRKK
ncbi:flagellar protein FlgN [Sporosalibacterium faouarense]|uniref:flagellar protein FlgN n=1 Tax=Sporosalibacterium faouarense TaxID=516123 RepID=UPI00141CEDCE|nr:flagellar protein FlgN [Sporosalibacterium faouarense]MTI46787.1 flagellar protein FlgN [Bacillota bacterium]